MGRTPDRKRVDTAAEREALTDNPFGQLASLDRSRLPEHSGPTAPEEPNPAQTPPQFAVERTRKGGWPVRVERRTHGKVVTVITGVSGDLDSLLKVLRHRCGSGGTAREDCIELQGDHQARVAALLDELLNPSGQ